ncbi:hypothetical protein MMC10_005937 [Thelotrema lepadinum]|nr:hypothetical protein [Thelotrema lepadinum]
MGRKPDELILTYFYRGDKLPDQSNRYSYTCKLCGNSSTTPRCPSINAEDVSKIVALQASKSADKARKGAVKASAGEVTSPSGETLPANGSSPIEPIAHKKLPLGQGRNFSGLEALAEASRQVERPPEHHIENGQAHELSTPEASHDPLIDPSLNSVVFENGQAPTSNQDLSSIAASANSLEASILQLQKHNEAHPKSPKSPLVEDSSDILHHASTWHVPIRPAPDYITDQLAKAATFPVAIAANPSTMLPGSDDVNGPPSKVTKTRSKFSASRRQEVQGVRQKRACIRCRMLRKPCSEEDPCPRCAEIKNPRLWSNACVRTKISEAFDLYSVGLFAAPARLERDRIKVSYDVLDENTAITLSPLDGERSSAKTLTPTSKRKTEEAWTDQQSNSIVLPREEDPSTEAKVSEYLSRQTDTDYPSEISKTIVYCKDNEGKESLLIQKAISLYKTTHALTSPDATLEIAHPGQALLPNPELGADFRLVTQNNSVSSRANGRSYSSTTHTTVLSIIEKIGSDQCRNLLNEMEKCLIARAQAFDLLVSAFLFFACVERLEWAFRRHEAEVSSGKQWLLPSPPSTYIRKAEEFASFLQGLLRSRHVVEQLSLDPITGFLMPKSKKDDSVRKWFEAVSLGPDLPLRRNATFSPSDPSSLRMKHCARFLLSTQIIGQIGFEQ